jgi:prepilin-type N-terminal cleavage/methylation domain-containing protein
MKKIMSKMKERKGFTLAELLIVVAIIAVLVAISIPIFSTQLEKAREATDLANVRAAYAEVTTAFIEDGQGHSASVPITSNTSDCKTDASQKVAGVPVETILKGSNPCTVEIDSDGKATINGTVATTGYLPAPSSSTTTPGSDG